MAHGLRTSAADTGGAGRPAQRTHRGSGAAAAPTGAMLTAGETARLRSATQAGSRTFDWVLLGSGVLILLLGVFVYVLDRRGAVLPVWFATTVSPIADSELVFGTSGMWLPSFAHAFSFSVLTAAVWRSLGRAAYGACLMWWLIDVAFEATQHPRLSSTVADAMKALPGQTWVAHRVANHFVAGTFDIADVVAITFGSVAAAGLMLLMRSLRHED